MAKVQTNFQNSNSKRSAFENLENRTWEFAKRTRIFVGKLPKTTANFEDGRQVIRASGSVGANYIEANEALSKKDFVMRIKISRKEAKESSYWFSLVDTGNKTDLEKERETLMNEAHELMLIFSPIVTKAVA